MQKWIPNSFVNMMHIGCCSWWVCLVFNHMTSSLNSNLSPALQRVPMSLCTSASILKMCGRENCWVSQRMALEGIRSISILPLKISLLTCSCGVTLWSHTEDTYSTFKVPVYLYKIVITECHRVFLFIIALPNCFGSILIFIFKYLISKHGIYSSCTHANLYRGTVWLTQMNEHICYCVGPVHPRVCSLKAWSQSAV